MAVRTAPLRTAPAQKNGATRPANKTASTPPTPPTPTSKTTTTKNGTVIETTEVVAPPTPKEPKYGLPKPTRADVPTTYPEGHAKAGKRIPTDEREEMYATLYMKWTQDIKKAKQAEVDKRENAKNEKALVVRAEKNEKTIAEMQQEASLHVSNAVHKSRVLTSRERNMKDKYVAEIREKMHGSVQLVMESAKIIAIIVEKGLYEAYEGSTKREALNNFLDAEVGYKADYFQRILKQAELNDYFKDAIAGSDETMKAIDDVPTLQPGERLIAEASSIGFDKVKMPTALSQYRELGLATNDDKAKSLELWKEACKRKEAGGDKKLPTAAEIKALAEELGLNRKASKNAKTNAARRAASEIAATEAMGGGVAQNTIAKSNPFAGWEKAIVRSIRGIQFVLIDKVETSGKVEVCIVQDSELALVANSLSYIASLQAVADYVKDNAPDGFEDEEPADEITGDESGASEEDEEFDGDDETTDADESEDDESEDDEDLGDDEDDGDSDELDEDLEDEDEDEDIDEDDEDLTD